MEIAILIPCRNEENTIAKVINDFKRQLPAAKIYVYDNNSTDQTARIAAENGAIVKREFRQGKGNVVRSMFRDIEADAYVLVDGDDTYPAEAIHDLLRPIAEQQADMVVGDRLSGSAYKKNNHRPFHSAGNRLVLFLINTLFHTSLHDIMSGYRAFSRLFAKTAPLLSPAFEVETEMTLHALDKRHTIREVPVGYRDRPAGSASKLNTLSDGARVLGTIFWIFRDYKPMVFFSGLSAIFLCLGLAAGILPIMDYIQYQYVYRVPLSILATGLCLLSVVFLAVGLILNTISRLHKLDYELMAKNMSRDGKGR
jgi:glycosyltransferase involved in cell wall biosynthesis